MGNPRWVGAGLVALSALSFGAMAIFARIAAAGGAEVTAVLFLRFLIAGAVMTVVMVVTGRRWPGRRNRQVLSLMGGVGYVLQSLCFFLALQYARAGLVSLLLYLYPVLVTVLAVIFRGERLSALRVGATLAALLGTVLTLSEGLEGRWIGVALGVSTALIYSVYILVGSRVLAEEDSLAAATVVMLSAAATFGVVVAITGPRFPATPDAWGAVLAIALVSTVIAMVSFFAGIQRLGAADAATLSTLEPVVTCLLAAIFLGEPVTPLQAVGGAIVLAAVVALARGEGRTIQVGKGATRSR